MQMRYCVAMSAMLGVPSAWSAELSLKVELPRLTMAEYHRPYAALWLERSDQSFAANLGVWYNLKAKNGEGTKWLKDLRQWWRKSGRELQMPVDGLSGATRAPGVHSLNFSSTKAPFDSLPAGDYQLVVEAAREAGGREVLRVPFVWPPKEARSGVARGSTELGSVSVDVRP